MELNGKKERRQKDLYYLRKERLLGIKGKKENIIFGKMGGNSQKNGKTI